MRSFLLLLASLAIVAHMIIPHDHHIAGQINGLRESCQLPLERSHHHPLFPSHCHAFNDLAAEKFSPVIVKQETQTGFISIVWCPDYIIPYLNLVQKVIQNSGKPFPEIDIPDFSLLRAPPSFC
jgi:hypothetical protein